MFGMFYRFKTCMLQNLKIIHKPKPIKSKMVICIFEYCQDFFQFHDFQLLYQIIKVQVGLFQFSRIYTFVLRYFPSYQQQKCTFFLLFQFCKKFRVGERCCEFKCLDPPGEESSRMLQRYRERNRTNGATTTTESWSLLLTTLLFVMRSL